MIRYTLLSEGSSDRALLPIIDWVIHQELPDESVRGERADLGRFPNPPKQLSEKIAFAIDQFPCDLLFIHRDSDDLPRATRYDEIARASHHAGVANRAIPVIPIRSIEAWLLTDEPAIRTVAGNPNGTVALSLPRHRDIGQINDPKQLLRQLIQTANGGASRRQRSLRFGVCAERIPQLIDDFSSLRELSAFAAFEQELTLKLRQI